MRSRERRVVRGGRSRDRTAVCESRVFALRDRLSQGPTTCVCLGKRHLTTPVTPRANRPRAKSCNIFVMLRFAVVVATTLLTVTCGGEPPLSFEPPHVTPLATAPATVAAPPPTTAAPTVAPTSTLSPEEALVQIQEFVETEQADWGKCGEYHDLAVAIGWPEEEWPKLSHVLHRESRCQPQAFNQTDPNGGSRGILQINQFWCRPNRYTEQGWLQDRGALESCEELHDPEVALRSGLLIWLYSADRNGNGWAPWAL